METIIKVVRYYLGTLFFIMGLGFGYASHICVHISCRLDGRFDL